MTFDFDTSTLADYRTFLKVRTMPRYRFDGWRASIPDEDAAAFGLGKPTDGADHGNVYKPSRFLFDYQAAIAAMAIRRRKFAAFVDCGLGKTLIITEFARHAAKSTGKPVLLVSPLMVLPQTVAEFSKFYPNDKPLSVIKAAGLREWLATGTGIGITNWDAMDDGLDGGRLGGIVADESSYLKSHYGKWGTGLVGLGRGVPFKLCATGTPAPNDRIEYAQHAVFLDQARTVNEFLARFFINRGIRRLVLLYSNRDELVFSPFAGIGSEGYVAMQNGRRFLGCELKPEYFAEACRNLGRAEGYEKRELNLFADAV